MAEEATIADLHQAIREGRTTCTAVVQAYVERARAYNGSCTALVTRDGAPVPAAAGATRAGRKVAYATATVAALATRASHAGAAAGSGATA